MATGRLYQVIERRSMPGVRDREEPITPPLTLEQLKQYPPCDFKSHRESIWMISFAFRYTEDGGKTWCDCSDPRMPAGIAQRLGELGHPVRRETATRG